VAGPTPTTKPTTAHKPGTGKPTATLGTKNFTEELILGQLYAQALRAKGFAVTLKSNIGPSEQVDRELAAKQIDGYPEYTGTILSVFGHNTQRPSSALQAYQLAAGVERHRGTKLLAWVERREDTRAVQITAAGRAGLAATFGIGFPPGA
jgi:osmoprotectant transport system substrate-binding protein